MIRKRITYANVMSSLAIFLVLGGATAFAASNLGKNSVGSKQLKKNAVTTAKIKKNAVTTAKIKKNAITGSKVKVSTLGTVPSATNAATAGSAGTFAGYNRKGLTRIGATPVASFEDGVNFSPQTVLFSTGAFTVYAQCFSQGGTVYGLTSIRTTVNGAILDSDEYDYDGEPFLDTNTPAEERVLNEENAGANDANYFGIHTTEFTAMAPDGTAIRGDNQIAVKNGTLTGGDGIYGAGNICLFAGEMTNLGS